MNFCKDCKFCYVPHSYREYCAHEASPRDPVDGHGQRCFHARYADGFCGPDGKHFEPRPPSFWQKLFGGAK